LLKQGKIKMHAVDIIEKKRDKHELTPDEIKWFIDAYTKGDVADYQAAAFCMAVYLNGMTTDETTALTMAMAESGEILDLSEVLGYVVDKHSSGGVGDKTTLVVLPLVASLGVPVAKMSGRGLGLTGGTLDKLEATTGFNVRLTKEELMDYARINGLALGGQTKKLAPADDKLYSLRDVTGTISSIPLIASSIMSKKIAAGAQGIVLDVKVGAGAFMKDIDQARELAETMVNIGRNVGRDMVAVISDMNQPLGRTVGNALEVAESIEILRGGGDEYVKAHCLEIAAYMLKLAGQGEKWTDIDAIKAELQQAIDTGAGLDKFRAMVKAQGGDVRMVDNTKLLAQARTKYPLKAKSAGYVHQVLADQIARAAFELGAGRERKEDEIDLAVGLEIMVKVGDVVEQGQTLAIIHANDEVKLLHARKFAQSAFVIQPEKAEPLPLFYGVIA
jgi:pyrimidine-nucleoside phosphorylase